jgi:hypothetical protein
LTGDFKLFDKLDTDSDGGVTVQEWHTYLRRVYQERGAQKAVKWVTTLLHTLRSVTSDEAEDADEQEVTTNAPLIADSQPLQRKRCF